MIPPRPTRAGLAAILSLVLVAGCATPSPTPAPRDSSASSGPVASSGSPVATAAASPSAAPSASAAALDCADPAVAAAFSPRPIGPNDPDAAVLSAIEESVQTIRGITASTPVPRNLLDEESLCAFVRQDLDRSKPPSYLAATERLYEQLGLVSAGVSLRKLYLDLESNQVVGFYDESTRQMYVVSSSGGIGPAERFIYAHEFDHALQDQAFSIKAVIGNAMDQTDRRLARTALAEGDATLLMSLWAQKGLTPAELMQVAGSAGPAPQAALDRAPAILRETLLWPYTAGLSVVLAAYTLSASFAGVDALWKNPPDTTEQVLHPDKLATREPAIAVAFPEGFAKRLGAAWKVSLEDTLGELELNILMRSGDPNAGTDPAAGWGGDRVALVEGPNGATGAVVDTSWDTSAAASTAFAELQKVAAKLTANGKHAAALMPAETRVVLVSANSDANLGAIANVLGLAG